MSVPEKHHFLPIFYLERWAVSSQVVRFVRPQGPNHPIHMKSVAPAAIAYERDLYAIPTAADPVGRQKLELELYQRVDDRAAIALQKIDQEQAGTGEDRVAFAQFVLSLPLRNPAQITYTREQLRKRVGEEATSQEIEDRLKAQTNILLAELIQSPGSIEQIAKMRVFKINVGQATEGLLTSDRPTMLSRTLLGRDAFILFPYAPDKLIVLANDPNVAEAFRTQEPDILVRAVNHAVVLQAESVVIGSDKLSRDFVDEHFQKPERIEPTAVDDNGMVRWKSPLTRVRALSKGRLLGGTAGPPRVT